jgi:hypothetical protein
MHQIGTENGVLGHRINEHQVRVQNRLGCTAMGAPSRSVAETGEIRKTFRRRLQYVIRHGHFHDALTLSRVHLPSHDGSSANSDTTELHSCSALIITPNRTGKSIPMAGYNPGMTKTTHGEE